jgi:transcriptional regulator with PAS, ATPase and Fis domain
MKDSRKTKTQLLSELAEYRQRVAELESAELEWTQTEQESRGSEAKLRALLATMTEVIFVLDAQGRYLKIASMSPGPLYEPTGDLLGKTLHQVFPTPQAGFFLEFVAEIEQYLPARKPKGTQEVRHD